MQKFVLWFVILILASAKVCYGQTKIDSLLRIVATHPRDTNEIKTLHRLGVEFMRKDVNKAKSYFHQEVTLAKSLRTDFGLSSGYSGLVGMHQNTGLLDSAQYYLDLMKLLAQNPSNKKAVTNYYSTAGLFYKNQGKFKEALPFLLEGLRLSKDGDKTDFAGQLLNVGNAYYNLGELKNAADYHLKALALFEEVKNKRGQSFCLNSLGNDYADLKQYNTAEKYFFRSEKLKEELGDKRGVLTSWMSLGVVYQQTNKPDLSMLYFKKALVRARELNLSLEESRVLFNMGSLLKQTKKNEEATKTFSEAMVLARQMGDSSLVSRIKTYVISLQNDLQKEKNEEQTLLQNVKISLESGALDNTAESYFALATWYESRKQFDKAYENLKQAQLLNDSIRGNQVILQLKKLEEEYTTNKKEKEIALLKKDQELQALALSRQRTLFTSGTIVFVSVIIIGILLINRYRVMNRTKRLLEIERMRNSIARDLHDDIGSALSSINILSKVAQDEKNGDTKNYLHRIGDQSARMMENMSDMVWSINPSNDTLEQVVIRMREFATEMLDNSSIEYEFYETVTESLVLSSDKRKSLFLIFKEAVNNAAKYSKATHLKMGLHQTNSTLVLRVEDNGAGFDERLATSGNGLRNQRERAKEINGALTITSTTGKGTVVELQLPIA
jgi:two-component system, NarL family, sensor histidine kinase UhpB